MPLCDTLITLGNGPDVTVLLHAAGSAPKALERLGAHLAPPLGRIAIPSFTRDGASLIGHVDEPEPMRAPVAVATALLEAPAGARRILVGHSMGGLMSLLATQAGAPVSALVLYEPIVLSLLDLADDEDRAAHAFDAAVIADMRAALARGDTEAGVARFIEAYGEFPWGRLPPRVREDLIARGPQLLREALATNGTRLDPARIAAIGVPVLVMHGTRSPTVAIRMAQRLGTLIPHAQVQAIEGAGHLGPVSAPDAVAAAITAFLAR
jgi:pimeloyl-ACP methyl ester carboxylesterase